MKNLKIITTILFCLVAFSCKKSNIGNSSDSIFNIYKATVNQHEGLLADVFDPSTKCKTYFYGNFNDSGVPKDVKSIVLEFSNTDTLYNYILDDNNRIYLSYGSLKNGTKLNNVVKINYQNDDSASVNIYDYNWTNNTDSLIKQVTINYRNNTATTTYGRLGQVLGGDDLQDFQQEVNDISIKFRKYLFNGAIAVDGVLGGICIIGALGTVGTIGVACLAFSSLSTVLILFGDQIKNANAATLIPNTNPNAPISPTAVSAIIPNPIGTPTNPRGHTGKVLYYALSCFSGCIGSSGVGTQIRVEIANANQEIIASGTATVRDYTSPIPTNCDAGQPGDLVLTLPIGGYYTTIYIGSNVAYYSNVYITENGCNIVSL